MSEAIGDALGGVGQRAVEIKQDRLMIHKKSFLRFLPASATSPKGVPIENTAPILGFGA